MTTSEKIAERIAKRRALGMTADEYNAHLKAQEKEQKNKLAAAVRECLRASIRGTEKETDAVFEEYKKLGGK